MTGIPHYSDGRWSEGTDWLDSVWDDETYIENERSGLGAIAHLGHGDGFSITLYGPSPRYASQGRSEGVPDYVIEVDGENGTVGYLSAATLPDALDLLGKWAPSVTAYLLSEVWHDLAGANSGTGIMADILAAAQLAVVPAERRVRLAREPRRPQ